MWDVVLDAVLDSLKVFPFLLLLYIIIEVVEEKISTGTKFFKYTQGKYATLVGAGLGLIPQCGFSVVASDLYARRYIKVGTLLAIFIATSDEAVPIILSNPTKAYVIFQILAIKFVFALVVGYGADLILTKYYKSNPLIKGTLKDISAKNHNHEHDKEHKQEHKNNANFELSETKNENVITEAELEVDGCCGHNIEGKRSTLKQFFLHPLVHSLKVFAYILAINLIMGFVIHFVGEQNVVNFMQSIVWLQPLLVAIVGLIPNCASSVLITQLYLINGISFGATISGLCVNAGIALMVLFKENKNVKHNLFIVGSLLLASVILGYAIMGIMLLF